MESPPVIIPGFVVIQMIPCEAINLLEISHAGASGGQAAVRHPWRHAIDWQDLRIDLLRLARTEDIVSGYLLNT